MRNLSIPFVSLFLAQLPAELPRKQVDSLPSTERIRVARDSGYFPRSVTTRKGALVFVYRTRAAVFQGQRPRVGHVHHCGGGHE
jgi:hypothetical protein